jgi:hypothetical protein
MSTRNILSLKIEQNGIPTNIISVHLHHDPEKRAEQLNNLNKQNYDENTIIFGDMNGDFLLPENTNLVDYTPTDNTFISEINGTRCLDKVISNFKVESLVDNPFMKIEDNIGSSKKQQVTFAGVDKFVKQFVEIPENEKYVCSKDKKHRCNKCFRGIKFEYLDNNEISWFQVPRKLDGRLSDHSMLIAKTNDLVFVQWNILAMIQDYCGYFIKDDKQFILNPDRIQQMCTKIKSVIPNIICLQEVDAKSLEIFKNEFNNFTVQHSYHPGRKDGVAILVENTITIEKCDVISI